MSVGEISFLFLSIIYWGFLLKENKLFSDVLLFAIILRVALNIINSFIFTLPDADGDAIFYVEKAQVWREIFLQPDPRYEIPIINSSDFFPFMLGYILLLFVPTTFNVGLFLINLSILSLILVKEILKNYIDVKDLKLIVLIISLYPISAIYNSIPLREGLFTFLTILSIYFLDFHFRKKSFISLVVFLAVVGINYLLNAAAGFLFISYVIYIIFFTFGFGKNIFISMGSLLLFLSLATVTFPSFFQNTYQFSLKVFDIAVQSGSNLNYPSWALFSLGEFQIVSIVIRLLFFLFSPFIFQISSPMHLVIFFDAIVFIYIFVYIFSKIRMNKKILLFLLIYILFHSLIYSFFTNNSGTATRHRHKVFLPIMLVYGISRYSRKYELREKLNNNKGIIFVHKDNKYEV